MTAGMAIFGCFLACLNCPWIGLRNLFTRFPLV